MGTEIASAQQGVFPCQNFQAGSRRTSPEVGIVTIVRWKEFIHRSTVSCVKDHLRTAFNIFIFFPSGQLSTLKFHHEEINMSWYPLSGTYPRPTAALRCTYAPVQSYLSSLPCRFTPFCSCSFCAPFCTSFVAMISPSEYFALDTYLHITHVFDQGAQLRELRDIR